MNKSVSYDRQTFNNPNPIARFAHRSRYKASLQLAEDLLPENGYLADFGAGDGRFLHQIGSRRPDVRKVAIEPYMEVVFPAINRISSIHDIPANEANLIVALEVAEHLTDEELSDFLTGAKQALNPSGRLLITVPIMYGLILPVKEVSRMILHRRFSDTSIGEMVAATLGRPIPRTPSRNSSHKGFDFRWLEKQIQKYFAIEQQFCLPWPRAPWWISSQAVFIGRKEN